MLDISTVKPAPGAGRLTPQQLQSAAWRHYGERVLFGAGLLDAGMPASREGASKNHWRGIIVRNQAGLDLRSSTLCVLGLIYGGYCTGADALGFDGFAQFTENPVPYQLGFVTCTGHDGGYFCDPVARAYREEFGEDAEPGTVHPASALGDAWVMYCEATQEMFA